MSKKKWILAVFSIVLLVASSVIAGTFKDSSEEEFNNGTYANTFYNTSASYIQLNETYNYGNFTSRVFDAGSKADWKNFSWNGNTGSILVTVDAAEDTYKSIDLGSNWFVVNDSFSGGTVDAGDLVSMKNGTLYIADNNQDIWRSPTYGRSWTKVNDDYSGAESQNPKTMIITNDNHLYIFEGDEDVWNSSDDGVTWTKVNDDFDGGGETADAKGAAVNRTGAIFVIANNADLYVSTDKGVTWTEINDDYNGADGNNADDMAIDSNDYLYILNTDDVWNSSNGGINWTKINDDFNPGDSNNGFTITADINDFLYIIDGSEDVFISRDKGVTWTKVASNINGGSGNVKGTIAYNQSVVNFQARSDDDNSTWGDFIGPDNTNSTYYTNLTLSILNVSNNRYFQYITYFETNDTDYSPTLLNVTINYEPDNPPYWSENTTDIVAVFNSDNTSWVQIKWQDDDAIDTAFIESNYSGAAVNYTPTENVSLYKHEAVMPAGSHYWKSHSNDSGGQWNESEKFVFTISKAASSVNLLLNATDGDLTVVVNDTVNITGILTVPSAGTVTLYENSSQLDQGSSPLTHIKTYNETGIYNLTVYYPGSQNYTEAQEEHRLTVNPDIPPYWSENSTDIAEVFSQDNASLLRVKWQDDRVVDTVLIESNYSGSSANYSTTKNGSFYSYEVIMPAGDHYWKSYANDSSRQWNESETFTFTISKAISESNLLLNNTDGGIMINIYDSVNITGTLIVPSSGAIILYENRTQLVNGSVPLTVIKTYNETGVYNITAYFSGNKNYTESQEEHLITVTKRAASINLLLNNTDGGITITVDDSVNMTGELSIPPGGEITLYENGTQIANGTSSLTLIKQYNDTGIFNITVYYAGDENYTEVQEEHTITVENAGGGGSSSSSSSSSSDGPNSGVPDRRLGQEISSQQVAESPAPIPGPGPPNNPPANPVTSEEYNLPSFEQSEGPTGRAITGSVVEEGGKGLTSFLEKNAELKKAIGLSALLGTIFASLIFRYEYNKKHGKSAKILDKIKERFKKKGKP